MTEKKMFGGIIFMLQGNICCGVHRGALIRAFDLTGRQMKAWVLVEAKGLVEDAQLGKWVDRAVKWAGSLLPK